jgi:hypothetical protein
MFKHTLSSNAIITTSETTDNCYQNVIHTLNPTVVFTLNSSGAETMGVWL